MLVQHRAEGQNDHPTMVLLTFRWRHLLKFLCLQLLNPSRYMKVVVIIRMNSLKTQKIPDEKDTRTDTQNRRQVTDMCRLIVLNFTFHLVLHLVLHLALTLVPTPGLPLVHLHTLHHKYLARHHLHRRIAIHAHQRRHRHIVIRGIRSNQ